jgi:hypothetical protein
VKRLDTWAKKMGRSRSRFIVEELDNRPKVLDDEETIRMYNDVYADPDVPAYDHEIAEEMFGASSMGEKEEKGLSVRVMFYGQASFPKPNPIRPTKDP